MKQFRLVTGWWACVTLISAFCGSGVLLANPIVHPGDNTDPDPGAAGVMPYEMAGRPQTGKSLVDFADVTGWEVEGQNAEGWLHRTRDERLWSEYSGKLVYVGKGDKPVLNVRLPKPVLIPEPWNMVNWWTFGNVWGWSPDPKRPCLGTAILLRDADGKEFAMWPGRIDHAYWFMMCARLNAKQKAEFKRPFSFVGYQFQGLTNTEKQRLYLGPCYFLQEQLEPLSFPAWPPEKLPFPNRPETILPINKTAEFRNHVDKQGNKFVFTYEGKDARLEYVYEPKTATLGDITLRHAGASFQPCAGGGIQIFGPGGPLAPTATEVTRKLESCELSDGHVRAAWRLSAGDRQTRVTYDLTIRQKSLLVEMATSEANVDRVTLGRAEPLVDPKLFKIPYLTFGGNNTDPHVLCAGGLFLFSQFDWYVSDASRLWGAAGASSTWAAFNGGAEYSPKTDGTRNPVRERLFLTASPDVQEVLPSIPNPPSPFKDVQGERLWRVKGGADYKAELTEARKLRGLGCDKMTIRYHEDTWRDGGESFTFRLNAAPGRGGDAALRQFGADVKSLGWRVGLYSNYTDFAPVNALWSPDHVNRLINGDWQPAWMRCYAPKPMWGWQMEAQYAPLIHKKFGSNHSYCDVHTVFMPWEREDYDARVPGAATFRRTYECFGRLLANEKVAYEGPVYSEGRNHWVYAGLSDGNYAQLASPAPSKEPLLVDFDLLMIHPLEMDAGMGAPGMFFGSNPPDLDQFIATTVAYGHIGFAEWNTIDGLLKIYNMVQPAQKLYAMVPVRQIEYELDGQVLDTSHAMIAGAHLNNHVHVVYENGTEVYVNGSDKPWSLRLASGALTLPRWGYVVTRGKDLVCASAQFEGVAEGRRIDVSFGEDLRYLDSRGPAASMGGLTVEGSAILKKNSAGWQLIPATRFTRAVFSPRMIGLDPDRLSIVAVDEQGKESPAANARIVEGVLEVVPGESPATRYQLLAR